MKAWRLEYSFWLASIPWGTCSVSTGQSQSSDTFTRFSLNKKIRNNPHPRGQKVEIKELPLNNFHISEQFLSISPTINRVTWNHKGREKFSFVILVVQLWLPRSPIQKFRLTLWDSPPYLAGRGRRSGAGEGSWIASGTFLLRHALAGQHQLCSRSCSRYRIEKKWKKR